MAFYRKLGRNSGNRKALFRSILTSFFKYGRIETTITKAKEVADKGAELITLAKKNDLHARRQVMAVLNDETITKKLFEEIKENGYFKERITGDSAEPKSIDELKGYGLRIKGAEKGKDSIKNGIQWIQDLEIIIHPRCVNYITEISNYTWDKDKFGNKLNVPIDDFNHLMDAMRYALEKYITNNKVLNKGIGDEMASIILDVIKSSNYDYVEFVRRSRDNVIPRQVIESLILSGVFWLLKVFGLFIFSPF